MLQGRIKVIQVIIIGLKISETHYNGGNLDDWPLSVEGAPSRVQAWKFKFCLVILGTSNRLTEIPPKLLFAYLPPTNFITQLISLNQI